MDAFEDFYASVALMVGDPLQLLTADFNGNHPENPGRTPKPVEGWFGSFSYDLPGFVHPRFSVF